MQNGRWTIWALLAWAVTGVLLAFFERPLFDALWIIVGFLLLGFAVVGAILFLIVAGYAAWRRSLLAAASALGLVISGFTLWHMEPYLSRTGDDAIFCYRFTAHRAAYDSIVAEAERTQAASAYGEREGVRFQVDAGPPVRVVFPQPGGILDNWEGVIYDPTGEVLKARGWVQPGELSAPPGVRELFGGNLVSCRHVEGNYYRCWFT